MRWPNKRPIIYCIDCGKQLGRTAHTSGSKRCRKHAPIERSKRQKGTNHWRWKGGKNGRMKFCIDCGKELHKLAFYENTVRCAKCNYKFYSGKNNRLFGSVAPFTSGIYYKSIYMRSSWEVKYAQYLDTNNIKWIYEPKTFELLINHKPTTYRPDFYLPETNEYIEIKGYWYRNSMEKIKTFRIAYPSIKLTVLMEQDLKTLGLLKYSHN